MIADEKALWVNFIDDVICVVSVMTTHDIVCCVFTLFFTVFLGFCSYKGLLSRFSIW